MPRQKKEKGVTAYLLPGTLTTVYQSNRITNGTFQGFGLLHTKIFIAIIKSLQEAIRAEMNGLNWEQMDLFEEVTKDSILVKLNLKDITTPNHYSEAVKATKQLMGLVIMLKKNDAPKGYISFRTLLTGVDQPVKLNGKTVLIIHILKTVAKEIIFLDKNKNGNSINFTKYFYENVMSYNSKYTMKLAMLISSWKNKGGFYISIEDLRKILDLKENEYKNFNSLKKRVLIPAQNELEKKGDCWFNLSQKNFENKIGKKIIGFNFKVISNISKDNIETKLNQLKNMLMSHAGFNNNDLYPLKEIFEQPHLLDDFIVKTIFLINKKRDENGDIIVHKIPFITKSLLNYYLEII